MNPQEIANNIVIEAMALGPHTVRIDQEIYWDVRCALVMLSESTDEEGQEITCYGVDPVTRAEWQITIHADE